MRIESAAIGMDSARSYSSRTEHKQSVTFTLLNAQEKVKETDNENVKENFNENKKDFTESNSTFSKILKYIDQLGHVAMLCENNSLFS